MQLRDHHRQCLKVAFEATVKATVADDSKHDDSAVTADSKHDDSDVADDSKRDDSDVATVTATAVNQVFANSISVES